MWTMWDVQNLDILPYNETQLPLSVWHCKKCHLGIIFPRKKKKHYEQAGVRTSSPCRSTPLHGFHDLCKLPRTCPRQSAANIGRMYFRQGGITDNKRLAVESACWHVKAPLLVMEWVRYYDTRWFPTSYTWSYNPFYPCVRPFEFWKVPSWGESCNAVRPADRRHEGRWDWEQLFSGIPAKPVTNVVTCGAAHASTSSPMASASLAVPLRPCGARRRRPSPNGFMCLHYLLSIILYLSVYLSSYLPTFSIILRLPQHQTLIFWSPGQGVFVTLLAVRPFFRRFGRLRSIPRHTEKTPSATPSEAWALWEFWRIYSIAKEMQEPWNSERNSFVPHSSIYN